jgi:hypothetical protein
MQIIEDLAFLLKSEKEGWKINNLQSFAVS